MIETETETLLLASASAARAAMLTAAGVAIEVLPARIDEEAVKAAMRAEGAPARDQADKLAELKALRISARRPGQLVLGADQVLVAEGAVYDKPADRAEAEAHLGALRGKPHELLSAAVIALNGAPIWRHVGRARLLMRPFTDAFLSGYLDQMGESVTETVGGYRLEGEGAQLFARVDGDYFTVLGLPLLEVLGFLRARGVLVE
ncbi:MAG: Maf family protein [Pseudomonadota bacterium]